MVRCSGPLGGEGSSELDGVEHVFGCQVRQGMLRLIHTTWSERCEAELTAWAPERGKLASGRAPCYLPLGQSFSDLG